MHDGVRWCQTVHQLYANRRVDVGAVMVVTGGRGIGQLVADDVASYDVASYIPRVGDSDAMASWHRTLSRGGWCRGTVH